MDKYDLKRAIDDADDDVQSRWILGTATKRLSRSIRKYFDTDDAGLDKLLTVYNTMYADDRQLVIDVLRGKSQHTDAAAWAAVGICLENESAQPATLARPKAVASLTREQAADLLESDRGGLKGVGAIPWKQIALIILSILQEWLSQ